MPRDYRVYLEDIITAIGKIHEYSRGLSFEELGCDSKTLDAVVRNLEIIGEAAKKIPEAITTNHPTIEWRKIGGLSALFLKPCQKKQENYAAIFINFSVDADKNAFNMFVNFIPLIVN